MYTLFFLVCNTLSGECYATTSEVIYKTEQQCQQDALRIIDNVKDGQKKGLYPPEEAIYVCHNWGDPA